MKNLINIIRKDCLHLRWPILVWLLLLVATAVHRIATNSMDTYFATNTFGQTGRSHPLDAGFYPLFFITLLISIVTAFGSEPLNSPTSYWRTRPISARALLHAKWTLILIYFVVAPFVVFLTMYLCFNFSFPLALGAATLKAITLGSVAFFVAAIAYAAPGWGRFAGIVIGAVVIVFTLRAVFSETSDSLPLLSHVAVALGCIIAAILAMAVHRRKGNPALTLSLLFGSVALISGTTLALAKDAKEQRWTDIYYSRIESDKLKSGSEPLPWMHELDVKVSSIDRKEIWGPDRKQLVPYGFDIDFEVHDPSTDKGGFVHLFLVGASLENIPFQNQRPQDSQAHRLSSLSNLVGKSIIRPERERSHSRFGVGYTFEKPQPKSGTFECDVIAKFYRWKNLGAMPLDEIGSEFDIGTAKFRRVETEPWPNDRWHLDFDTYHHVLAPRDRANAKKPRPLYREPEYFFVFEHPDDEHSYQMWGDFRRATALMPPDYSELAHRLSLYFWPVAREGSIKGGTLHIFKEENLGDITIPLSMEVPPE